MDINQIKRVKNAMTGVDEESAKNMLLALLLDAYYEGSLVGTSTTNNDIIQMFVDGTR